jgi:hypothetical protein
MRPTTITPTSFPTRFDSDGFPIESGGDERQPGLREATQEAVSSDADADDWQEEEEGRGRAAGGEGAIAGMIKAGELDWQGEARQEALLLLQQRAGGGEGGSGAGALLAPAGRLQGRGGGKGRPISGNKKFLDKYSLGGSGLFAPM